MNNAEQSNRSAQRIIEYMDRLDTITPRPELGQSVMSRIASLKMQSQRNSPVRTQPRLVFGMAALLMLNLAVVGYSILSSGNNHHTGSKHKYDQVIKQLLINQSE